MATAFSRNVGSPSHIIAILEQVWSAQRHVEFDRHSLPRTLPSCGVPQGCSFAPTALACIKACGHKSVNEILHNSYGYSREATQIANTKTYMDDKTFVDPAYQRCLDRASAWETWSSTVGLLESSDKAQALAKTKAMQDKLVVDRPQWSQEKTMQVLRVSIRARPSKNTAVESQRIAAAVTRSKLLGCLLVSFRRKLELYKVFVVPKALFRMFQRFVA